MSKLLDSWLLDAVVPKIQTISLPCHHFINRDQPRLMKVLKFTKKLDDNTLTAILSDATHYILVYFPKDKVNQYEIVQNERLTYETVNSLFKINEAQLTFETVANVNRNFNLNQKSLGIANKTQTIATLQIVEFERFHSDRVSDEKSFIPIYKDRLYRLQCKKGFEWDRDEFDFLLE